jgi:hypothetical protein
VRSLAAQTGVSKSSVRRYLSLFGVQPHRSKSFKLSTDPFFIEKVRDVVGLYLTPPDYALVLCVDEKSQVQRRSNGRCRPDGVIAASVMGRALDPPSLRGATPIIGIACIESDHQRSAISSWLAL